MPNSTYWKKRMEAIEKMSHDKGADYAKYVKKQFENSIRSMEKEIEVWYGRIAVNNDISLAAAKKLLRKNELEDFHMTVKEYIKKGETLRYSDEWAKQLENASAKVHINRLEALKLQLRQKCETLYGSLEDGLGKTMKNIYEDGYYHTAYEIMKGQGVGYTFHRIDARRIEKAIDTVWAGDGKNFRARCWTNKEKLTRELQTVMTQSIIRGEAPDKAIKQLAKRMNVSKHNAGRLIMTESAFISSQSQKDCYKELEVEQFEFVATLDSITSEICRAMDGKVFKMSDYEIGVNAPPLHCFCRSCTVPHFEDNFGVVGKRAARGTDGKTVYVDADLTYEEWKEKFVESDKTGLQEVQQDAITDFTKSRKQYDEQLHKLAELEQQSNEMLDAYMNAMDTPQASKFEEAFNAKYDEAESFKQIVKDLKAQLSGKEAKAVRQVEKNLSVKTGIQINNIEMTGLPYDSADLVYNSYKTVLNKYPELKGQLAAFKFDGVHGDAYAGCNILTGGIKAHGIFSDFNKLVQTYNEDVAVGFHPFGTDYKGIIVHELGHALDGYMTKHRLLDADFNGYGIIRTSSQTVKDMTLKLCGFDKQEIAIELKQQGLTLFQRRDILEQREKDFITQHISSYAANNEREFFAECFTEYMTSDNPREAAKVFGEIIDKALGR